MNFNKFLKSIFGDKSSRDMKLIQPLVEKVKEVYPEIKKLSNDELRAKTKEIQKYVQDAAVPYQEKIKELKDKIEETPIDEREPIFDEIDKLDKLGKAPIVMTSPIVRMYFKKLTMDYFTDLIVLSYNEVESNVELQSVGMVTI